MKLENKLASDLRNGLIKRPPRELQTVTKRRIIQVLRTLDRGTHDQVDAVFALLDNQTPNWFKKAASKGFKFSDGASTAHIACHIGILQRKSGKLDREGRDYWLKPLWEIGAVEKAYFDAQEARFLPGHPVAKSPASAYRIAHAFLEILKASPAEGAKLLAAWSSEDATRARLQVQAELAEAIKTGTDSPHYNLIIAACEIYVPNFLPGFVVLYIDATDGERITPQQRGALLKAGVAIELGDSMPDILLWNEKAEALWIIEAVTSDGEVDLHKVRSLTGLAQRSGKKSIGFTTAYATWKDAAARQGKHKNIAPGTHIWIQEDGGKQLTVETFELARRRLHQ
jgi:hypothetical protein